MSDEQADGTIGSHGSDGSNGRSGSSEQLVRTGLTYSEPSSLIVNGAASLVGSVPEVAGRCSTEGPLTGANALQAETRYDLGCPPACGRKETACSAAA